MSDAPAPAAEAGPPAPPGDFAPAEGANAGANPVLRRVLWVLAFVLFVVAACQLIDYRANRTQPLLAGDAWEYWLIASSFDRHGTPELLPGDKDPVYSIPPSWVWPDPPIPPHAYAENKQGRWFGVHFWGYAMTGVPAKRYLRATDRIEHVWPDVINAFWFVFAIGVVLFASKAPVGERLALAGLSAAGPGYVYIGWPGPELYTWAFVLIAVSMYRDKRYVLSGIGVGIAATQNPTVILFAVVPVLAAFFERRWLNAIGAALGGAIGLFPYAFFLYHFGRPNLIADDFARTAYIRWIRTWSQLTDFNQGLLPFVPLLVIGGAIGAARIIYLRDRRGLLLLAGGIAVALGTQVSRNWNSGCDMVQRYLVWMIPLLAGVAVWGIGGRWRLWLFALAAVAAHVAIVPVYREHDPETKWCLGHGPIAKWVLNNYPRAYVVEPEIFVERTRAADDWPMTPAKYPIGYANADGVVTKMFIDAQSIDQIAKVYEVDPAYLEELRADAAKRPLVEPTDKYYFPTLPPEAPPRPARVSIPYFVHPPKGAVKVRAAPQVPKQ